MKKRHLCSTGIKFLYSIKEQKGQSPAASRSIWSLLIQHDSSGAGKQGQSETSYFSPRWRTARPGSDKHPPWQLEDSQWKWWVRSTAAGYLQCAALYHPHSYILVCAWLLARWNCEIYSSGIKNWLNSLIKYVWSNSRKSWGNSMNRIACGIQSRVEMTQS